MCSSDHDQRRLYRPTLSCPGTRQRVPGEAWDFQAARRHAAGTKEPPRARGSRRDAPYLAPRRAYPGARRSGSDHGLAGAGGSAPTALALHHVLFCSARLGAGLCAVAVPVRTAPRLCCAAPPFIARGVAAQPSSPAVSPHPSPGTDPS